MMAQKNNSRSGERGNVFIMVLIGVILFAGLMFTFSRSARQGGENLSEKQAEIAANEIIAYAQSLDRAVNRLVRNNCSENDISFENPEVAGYTNPNSPADKSCHVFDVAGGKQHFLNAKTSWMDSSQSSWPNYGNFFITGGNEIFGLGSQCDFTRCRELLLMLPYVPHNLCLALNSALGYSWTTVPQETGWMRWTKFVGAFEDTLGNSIDEPSTIRGKSAACYEGNKELNSPPGTYHFYYALMIR